MINVAKIKYNEPIYYAPSYGNSMKVSINKPEDANRGRREWENYMRKRKRGQKK